MNNTYDLATFEHPAIAALMDVLETVQVWLNLSGKESHLLFMMKENETDMQLFQVDLPKIVELMENFI